MATRPGAVATHRARCGLRDRRAGRRPSRGWSRRDRRTARRCARRSAGARPQGVLRLGLGPAAQHPVRAASAGRGDRGSRCSSRCRRAGSRGGRRRPPGRRCRRGSGRPTGRRRRRRRCAGSRRRDQRVPAATGGWRCDERVRRATCRGRERRPTLRSLAARGAGDPGALPDDALHGDEGPGASEHAATERPARRITRAAAWARRRRRRTVARRRVAATWALGLTRRGDEAGVPPRRPPSGRRSDRRDVDPGAPQQPGDDRVGVPHVAGTKGVPRPRRGVGTEGTRPSSRRADAASPASHRGLSTASSTSGIRPSCQQRTP